MTSAPDRSPLSSRRQQILELHDKLGHWGPYQLLGLVPEADARSARAAFCERAKLFHPDALGPSDADLRDKAQAIFMEISSAYDAVRAGLRCRPTPPIARPVPAPVPALERPSGNPPAARVAAERTVAPAPVPEPKPAPRPAAPVVAQRPRWREVDDAIDEAEALLRQSEPAAAIEALHAVLRLATERQRGRVKLLLATAYLSEPGKRRNALVLLSEIAREQPSNAEALALLGSLYFREGLLGRAESTLARALAADPGHEQAGAALRAVRDALSRRAASKPRQSPSGGLFGRLLLMVR
jgi:tetratricopeptide (TPR) repeat protein